MPRSAILELIPKMADRPHPLHKALALGLAVSLGLPGSSFALRTKVPAEVPDTLTGLEEAFSGEFLAWICEKLRLPRDPTPMADYLRRRDLNVLAEQTASFLDKQPERIPEAQQFVAIHYAPPEGDALAQVESVEEVRQNPPLRQLAWAVLKALLQLKAQEPVGIAISRRTFLKTTAQIPFALRTTFWERALKTLVIGGYDPLLKLTDPGARRQWGNLLNYLGARDLYHRREGQPFWDQFGEVLKRWRLWGRQSSDEGHPLDRKYFGNLHLFSNSDPTQLVLVEELFGRAERSGALNHLFQAIQIQDPRFTPEGVKAELWEGVKGKILDQLVESGFWNVEERGVPPPLRESEAVKLLTALRNPSPELLESLRERVRSIIDHNWSYGRGEPKKFLTPEGKELADQGNAYLRLLRKHMEVNPDHDAWARKTWPDAEYEGDVFKTLTRLSPGERAQMLESLAKTVNALEKLFEITPPHQNPPGAGEGEDLVDFAEKERKWSDGEGKGGEETDLKQEKSKGDTQPAKEVQPQEQEVSEGVAQSAKTAVREGTILGATGSIPYGIYPDPSRIGEVLASRIVEGLERASDERPYLLGLPVGSTPIPTIQALRRQLPSDHPLWKRLRVIVVNDYVDPQTGTNIPEDHADSAMAETLKMFRSSPEAQPPLQRKQIWIPQVGRVSRLVQEILEAGGIQLLIVAVGPEGSVAHNFPQEEGFPADTVDSPFNHNRPRPFTNTYKDYSKKAAQWGQGVSFTLADLIAVTAQEGEIAFVASGSAKQEAVARFIEVIKNYSERLNELPIFFLWRPEVIHRVRLYVDEAAGNALQTSGLEEMGMATVEETAVETAKQVKAVIQEFLRTTRQSMQSGKVILIGPGALEGLGGIPALWPLLVEAAAHLNPYEREAVVIYTQDMNLAGLLREMGYRSYSRFSDVQAWLPSTGVTLYTTENEWLLRGQLPQVTETIVLTPKTFPQALARLLILLGYAPPGPEQLQELTDALAESV